MKRRRGNRTHTFLLLTLFLSAQFSLLLYLYFASNDPLPTYDSALDCSEISNHTEKIIGSNSSILLEGINESIPSESSSACLMVSDDNHILIEWIAYHYHVINLRYLIIISDSKSQTSPQKILNRWRDKMTIEIWNDTHIEMWNYTTDELKLHRFRQKLFNMKCLRTLKSLKKGWVLLTDTDEYITIHPRLTDHSEDDKFGHLSLPPILQPGSVLKFLQSLIMPDPSLGFISPCIPIYRRQYSAQESLAKEIDTHVPPKFDASSFATLRWRKWGSGKDKFKLASNKVCEKSRKAGPAKVLIDLERLRNQDLFHKHIRGSPHRPMESICSADNDFARDGDVGLMIHHYLGTLEQWVYRSADSRGAAYRTARYNIMKNPIDTHESDTVRFWLKGFVESIGETEASRLLKGVGKLERLPPYEKSDEILSDPKLGVEVYKAGDFVQVNYIDKWYWSEIREAKGGYYNIVVMDDCYEMLAMSVDKIRRNGTVDGIDLSVLLEKKVD